MKWLALLGALAILPAALTAGQESRGRRTAADLLGRRPPEWTVSHWRNGPPLRLADLRGKVVLVRWWTAPHCPFCRASAPALNDFHRRYRDRGLVVLGFYHHKSGAPLEPDQVAEWADDLGFAFPTAIDGGWRTLRRWWLDEVPASWTSVTFLLDRQGVVRHIHPGGQYVEGDAGHAALAAAVEKALDPDGPPSSAPGHR